jgi:hypothetical protein
MALAQLDVGDISLISAKSELNASLPGGRARSRRTQVKELRGTAQVARECALRHLNKTQTPMSVNSVERQYHNHSRLSYKYFYLLVH